MDIGDPTLYHCPSCNKPMLETRCISCSFYSCTVYSDGRHERYPFYPLFEPDLAKCPYCGALFFVHNLKGKTVDVSYEKYKHYNNIGKPILADYIKVIKKKLYKTKDEEIEARKHLWRSLNILTLGGIVLTDDEMKLWQDNCAALLSLLEPSLAQIQKGNVEGCNRNTGYITEDDCIEHLITTTAELHRNLEHFDQCAEVIKALPKEMKRLKDQYLKQCKKSSRFCFELKQEKPPERVLPPPMVRPKRKGGKKGSSMVEI